tara:strand:+ start:3911 stop:4318 length:408 start_codon:yes stop_codon:yes gene_type:complete
MPLTVSSKNACIKEALGLNDEGLAFLESAQGSLTGDNETVMQLILYFLKLASVATGGAPDDVTRTTAAKAIDYTIATGFYHCLVYVPTGVSATVDGIPFTGPSTYSLPSNYPAKHTTTVAITSISGGSVYVSESR